MDLKSVSFIFLFLLLALVQWCQPIFAQETQTSGLQLSLSPVFINLTTDPGKPVSSQIKIYNNGSFTETLTIRLQKFESGQNGDTPLIAPLDTSDEFGKWVSFASDKIIIPPGESKDIKFQISPPKTAALGYFYAFVIDRVKKVNPQPGGAAVSGSPAVPVLLEVRSRQAKRELQLVDFKTSQFVYEYLPVEFDLVLKNSGNIHAVPAGNIFIDAGSQQDIALLLANPGRGNILPNATRTYQVTWDDGFPLQKKKSVIWDFAHADRFRFGKYTAHALIVYDNGFRDIPLEAVVSFWVLPWKIITAILVVITLAIIGVRATIIGIVTSLKKKENANPN